MDDDQEDIREVRNDFDRSNPQTHELRRGDTNTRGEGATRVRRDENERLNDASNQPTGRGHEPTSSGTGVRFDSRNYDEEKYTPRKGSTPNYSSMDYAPSKFDGGVPLHGSKSLGMELDRERIEGRDRSQSQSQAGGESRGGLGRKMSVMQRLFGGRK